MIDKEIDKILSLGVELKLNAPLTEKFGLRRIAGSELQVRSSSASARSAGAI